MERRNYIAATGFLGFPKEFNGEKVAQLSVPINRGTNEDPKWDYLNIKLSTRDEDISFKDFDKKRVKVSGYITGEAFTPKGSDKEVRVPKIVVGKVEELEKGERGVNEIILTSIVKFKREFGEKGIGAQLSVRFDTGNETEPNYKYVNIPLTGSRERLLFDEDEIITVKGFIKGEFFKPKGAEKEIAQMVLVGMSIEEREKPGASTQTDNAPAPSYEETPKESPKATTIEDDEIPF